MTVVHEPEKVGAVSYEQQQDHHQQQQRRSSSHSTLTQSTQRWTDRVRVLDILTDQRDQSFYSRSCTREATEANNAPTSPALLDVMHYGIL